MKPVATKTLRFRLLFVCSSFALFLAAFVLFCSFTTNRFADEFLKQLGITKAGADQKIADGMLSGGVSLYGVKNAKNIALGNRKAVMLELLAYTKSYVNSPAFVKRYNDMREQYRPKDYVPETPEESRANAIKLAKEAVAASEESYKKADAQFKKIFADNLEYAKKNLKDVEDPANKQQVRYKQNYPRVVEQAKESNAASRANFLSRYPDNHLLYVKTRLQSFLQETEGVDYAAELVTKNGKKYFVNRAYESKGNYWKMAFRAGKEVVEPAREFVQNWIAEIQ